MAIALKITELEAELGSDIAARRAFADMPPSHQAEYCKWVGGAKKPQTREKRAKAATQMMKEWAAKRKG